MAEKDKKQQLEKAMEGSQERTTELPLRDILKQDHDEKRSRHEALGKRGLMLIAGVQPGKQPQKRGPDMGMD